jgi:hypothetical protein
MQLDLLEQLNKKRLMMARQEQDDAERAALEEQHRKDEVQQDSVPEAGVGYANPRL